MAIGQNRKTNLPGRHRGGE